MALNKPKVITWTDIDIICHHIDTNGAANIIRLITKLCVEYIICRGHFHLSVLSMWNLVTAPSIQRIWMWILYTTKHIICVFAIIWSLLYTKGLCFVVKCIIIIWRSFKLDKFVKDPYYSATEYFVSHNSWQSSTSSRSRVSFQDIPWTNAETIVTVSTKA